MYKTGTEAFIPCTVIGQEENGDVILSSDTDGTRIKADVSQVYEIEDMREIIGKCNCCCKEKEE